MARDAQVVITGIELSAAGKQAERVLSKYELPGLEDFVTIYTAVTRKGLLPSEALEVGSGLTKNGEAPIDPGAVGDLEAFLRLVKEHPEKSVGYLAGLHDRLSARSKPIPNVLVDERLYERPRTDHPRIIGCDEELEEIVWSVEQLFCYNPLTGDNPELDAMYPAILLFGPPGTGKSSLCRYAIAEGQGLSRRLGTRFRYSEFSPGDYSKWVGESAQNMKRKLAEVNSPDGVGILVVDDLDMVLQSRDDQFANHGLLQVTAQLMQMLSGVFTEERGNSLILATTNRVDKIDSALMRRFAECYEIRGYSSLGQYRSFVDGRLSWADDDERARVAVEAYEQKMSPAELDNLSRKLYRRHRGRPKLR